MKLKIIANGPICLDTQDAVSVELGGASEAKTGPRSAHSAMVARKRGNSRRLQVMCNFMRHRGVRFVNWYAPRRWRSVGGRESTPARRTSLRPQRS